MRGRLLHRLGYRLQSPRKRQEGATHPEFRVTVSHAKGDGLVLHGETVGSERLHFGEATLLSRPMRAGRMTVLIVGVQMRRHWTCSVGGREWRGLAETLEEFKLLPR